MAQLEPAQRSVARDAHLSSCRSDSWHFDSNHSGETRFWKELGEFQHPGKPSHFMNYDEGRVTERLGRDSSAVESRVSEVLGVSVHDQASHPAALEEKDSPGCMCQGESNEFVQGVVPKGAEALHSFS